MPSVINRSIRSAAGKAFAMSAPMMAGMEKQTSFYLSIRGEKKMLNDKEVVTFSINGDCGPRALPEEYTNVDDFIKCVNECIKAKVDTL